MSQTMERLDGVNPERLELTLKFEKVKGTPGLESLKVLRSHDETSLRMFESAGALILYLVSGADVYRTSQFDLSKFLADAHNGIQALRHSREEDSPKKTDPASKKDAVLTLDDIFDLYHDLRAQGFVPNRLPKCKCERCRASDLESQLLEEYSDRIPAEDIRRIAHTAQRSNVEDTLVFAHTLCAAWLSGAALAKKREEKILRIIEQDETS